MGFYDDKDDGDVYCEWREGDKYGAKNSDGWNVQGGYTRGFSDCAESAARLRWEKENENGKKRRGRLMISGSGRQYYIYRDVSRETSEGRRANCCAACCRYGAAGVCRCETSPWFGCFRRKDAFCVKFAVSDADKPHRGLRGLRSSQHVVFSKKGTQYYGYYKKKRPSKSEGSGFNSTDAGNGNV